MQEFVVTSGPAARLQLWFLSLLTTKISCGASLNMTLTCSTYPLTQSEQGSVAPSDTSLISHDAHTSSRLRVTISNNKSSVKFWGCTFILAFFFLSPPQEGCEVGRRGWQKLPAGHCVWLKWDISFMVCEWVAHEAVILYKRRHLFNSKFASDTIARPH